MAIPVRAGGEMAAVPAPGGARARRPTLEAWLVVGLTALAAALRFSSLGAQSFWFDEAQAAHELHGSLGALLSSIGSRETSPPLWFLLAWLWGKLFGTGEAGLRSLSALAGTAVIPLLYGCGRQLVSARAGVAAALLGALSPFLIWYSQEAREYMLLTALCAASLLCFAHVWRGASRGWLIGWAVSSALALLTHFFAGFLIGPEALLLLAGRRRRSVAVAVAAVAAVEVALIPLAVSDTAHPLTWVTSFALSSRLQQVPVAFAMSMLYQAPLVQYGLLGAAVLTAAVLIILLAGAGRRELRGAGIAAGLAGCVIILPLLFALAGHDYYVPRALMPGWIPLAVVLGAACTASRARVAGALLGAAVVAMFIYAGARIDGSPQYQRPDWRAAARALGPARSARAVVAEPGSLAIDPLKLYIAGMPWRQPGGVVHVGELDVIGDSLQAPAGHLPAGVRLVARGRTRGGFLILRFRSAAGWTGDAPQLGAAAAPLLQLPAGAPAVLIQGRGGL